MKCLIVGDIHGNFLPFINIIEAKKPDIVIQVGDFGYWPGTPGWQEKKKIFESIKVPIYWCDGNHENHKIIKEKCDNLAPGETTIELLPNCFYVKRGSLLNINNTKILFMGGANSIDKNQRTLGFDYFTEEIISSLDFDNITDERPNIIISHTCPNEFVSDLQKRIYETQGMRITLDNDPSRKALSILLEKFNPELWFFGHWHTFVQKVYNNTLWSCISMNTNTQLDPWYIEIEI